ncbi:hypothetical protein [Streptomyces sp. SID13726]|uniref:hypothetical protein n=1 Tax=Streptomyces sp. SID13726 TaxID=2706058 RepID=UPI001EF2CE07|nr:hypothetical protein [Streptomyces sp. SID13726]
MNQQQYPQHQPGWGGPQQPYGQPPFQSPPPKKAGAGKVIGLGCLGVVGLFVLIGAVGAAVGGGSNSPAGGGSSTTGTSRDAGAGDAKGGAVQDSEKKADGKQGAGEKGTGEKAVVFKVWGTAPAGVLGPLDITYGSDSDNRDGDFQDGEFEATLPLDEDALYFNVTAQLQGSGDIHCSVTVDGKTKKAHAAGDYNICNAQLSSGLLGGWD